MKKIGFLLLVLVLGFSLMIGCSSEIADDFETGEDGIEEPVDVDFSENELVVSIDGKEQIASASSKDIATATIDISSQQVKKLEGSDFKVVDSLFGSSQGQMQPFSPNFTANIATEVGFVHTVKYSKEYDSIEDAKEALREALEEKGETVRYIEPNYTYEAIGDVDSLMHSNQKWHYEMINAPTAWETTKGSSAVKIAVLDTGIDAGHRNLSNLVDTRSGANFTNSPDGDRQGHGTHVAGTIASYGSVSGVMQEASLVDVKVLGDSGSGSLNGIQRGILYAADIGVDVINMSLGGGGYSRAMNEAIQTAHNGGSVVVTASGNDGNSSVSYPASYSNALAVGAVDSNRNRARFSNYGSNLDVVAPGHNIYSTYPNNRYNSLSGTSMAAPHVAGVAGLLRAVNGDLSADQVWSAIKDTAQQAGREYEYGKGIVDVAAALESIDGAPQPDPEPEPEPDPDPNPEPEPDLVVAIQAVYNDQIVTRVERNTWWSSNVYIREREWQENDAQKWEAKYHGDSYYSFVNLASGNALDVNSSYSGDVAVEKSYDESSSQKWRVFNLDNGAYALQNSATGYVLHGERSNWWSSGSDRIIQENWNDNSNQQWNIHVLNGSSSQDLDEADSLSNDYQTVDKQEVEAKLVQ